MYGISNYVSGVVRSLDRRNLSTAVLKIQGIAKSRNHLLSDSRIYSLSPDYPWTLIRILYFRKYRMHLQMAAADFEM